MTSSIDTGGVGACAWVWIEGNVDAAGHARVMDALRAWGASSTPTVMLIFTFSTNAPTVSERRDLAEVVRGFKNPDNLRGLALVTNSVLVRGAIGWLVKTSTPYRVFGKPAEAIAWLKDRGVEVDATGLHAAIKRLAAVRW